MEYLPSKKVLVVVIAAGILVWTAAYNSDSQNLVAKEQTGVSIAHAESIQPDTDNDGLSDWEEVLFDTKINNPDSNNNGVSDGEELVSQKSNLLIKASDSPLNYISEINNALADAENFDPINSLATEPKFYPDKFKEGDIITIPTSTSTITIYVSKILLSMIAYADDIEREPLEIIDHWLQTFDEKDLEELSYISKAEKKQAEELMFLEIPDKFSSIHLDLVNNIHHGALALDDIDETIQDPIAGFFAAANYANYRSKHSQAIIKLTEYFDRYVISSPQI